MAQILKISCLVQKIIPDKLWYCNWFQNGVKQIIMQKNQNLCYKSVVLNGVPMTPMGFQ